MNFRMSVLLLFFTVVHGICSANQPFLELIEPFEKHVYCLAHAPYVAVDVAALSFDDDVIQSCAESIRIHKTFACLQTSWNYIKEYKHDDEKTLTQFAALLIVVYESIILAQNHTATIRATSWLAIIGLYIRLSLIPLPKLFDILEECWENYQYILENFQVEGKFSVYKWLKEYWWVPTTAAVFFVVSFIRWYRGRRRR